MVLICLFTSAGICQTDINKPIIKDTITISKTAKIEIHKDSSNYRFQLYPELTRIYITDTMEVPLTTILVDENGQIIELSQNFQNKINFTYDPETGDLKYISYRNNAGKLKSKKIKN